MSAKIYSNAYEFVKVMNQNNVGLYLSDIVYISMNQKK